MENIELCQLYRKIQGVKFCEYRLRICIFLFDLEFGVFDFFFDKDIKFYECIEIYLQLFKQFQICLLLVF